MTPCSGKKLIHHSPIYPITKLAADNGRAIHEIALENVVCEMAAIVFRERWVNY